MNTNDLFNHYSRDFIFWKMDSREDLKEVVEMKDKITGIETNQIVIMIINIIVCIIVSIILTIS